MPGKFSAEDHALWLRWEAVREVLRGAPKADTLSILLVGWILMAKSYKLSLEDALHAVTEVWNDSSDVN